MRTCSSEFKGPLRDDYVLPAAHYELGVLAWMEAEMPAPSDSEPASDSVPASGDSGYRQTKLDEAQAALERVAKWEAFCLDTRIGMRVQTGLGTIKWLKARDASTKAANPV